MNVVEFTHFSCYYKRKNELTKALDDLSFSVAEGELFVVVGESGMWKDHASANPLWDSASIWKGN